MSENVIVKDSDTNMLRIVGPLDKDGAVIDSGVTCTAKLFDEAKDTRVYGWEAYLTAEAAAGQAVLSLDVVNASVSHFIGDTLTMLDESGVTVNYVILSADEANNQVTLTSNLTSTVPKGRRVLTLTFDTGRAFLPLERPLIDVRDRFEIEQEDGTFYAGIVSSIYEVREKRAVRTTSITTDQVLPGASVRRRYGLSDVTGFSLYGTPVAGSKLWGWEAAIPSANLAEMQVGELVRAEMLFNGGAGQTQRFIQRGRVVQGVVSS